MDLELGLKITHTIDDHASSSTNFRIAKDISGPLFVSKETESTFILIAHLKGYKREHVKIDINEDGTQIGISGEKLVREKVMLGWIMYKNEAEVGFRKVFRIPQGVVVDRIKAKFNEHKSTLTIVMPKLVKGIRGIAIEEVKEDGVATGLGRQQMTQPAAEEVPEKDGVRGKMEEEFGEPEKNNMEENRPIEGKGVDEEEPKKGIVADDVLQKDVSGGEVQEDQAKSSKTGSMQDNGKAVSENSEEPKIAKTEEVDGIEKEKVGIQKLGTEIVADSKVSPEVAKPSQETRATKRHIEKKASELPNLEEQTKMQKRREGDKEMPNAELEEQVRGRPEASESSKLVEQETQVQKKQTADDVQLQKQEPISENPASNQRGKEEGSHGNEIQEVGTNQENIKEKEVDDHKCESSGSEKRKELREDTSNHLEKKKPDSEKSNLLCSPLIIAGSALFVSLVMLAINRFRTRKR